MKRDTSWFPPNRQVEVREIVLRPSSVASLSEWRVGQSGVLFGLWLRAEQEELFPPGRLHTIAQRTSTSGLPDEAQRSHTEELAWRGRFPFAECILEILRSSERRQHELLDPGCRYDNIHR